MLEAPETLICAPPFLSFNPLPENLRLINPVEGRT